MRKIGRLVMYIIMPWKRATNALWYQVRIQQKRLNGITFKLNEIQLALENGKKRGRPPYEEYITNDPEDSVLGIICDDCEHQVEPGNGYNMEDE